MPTFESNSWELPFDGAVHEEFKAQPFSLSQWQSEWQGQCLWKLRVTSYHTDLCHPPRCNWFGASDERQDAGFVLCRPPYCAPKGFSYPSDAVHSQKMFDTAWTHNHLARLFWLNDKGNLRREGETAVESLLVAASGNAVWRSHIPYNEVSDFEWGAPLSSAQFAEISAFDLWNRVRQQADEHNSEAAFARHFSRMQDCERRAFLVNEAEFKSVLCDLLLFHDVWDQFPCSDKLTLRLQSAREAELTYDARYALYQLDIPLSFSKDIERVWQWFEPFNPDVLNRDCVRKYREGGRLKIEVTAHRPTQHERLEARLRWQDWLASIQN